MAAMLFGLAACDAKVSSRVDPGSLANSEFGVYWPPRDLNRSPATEGSPLLIGELIVRQPDADSTREFEIRIELQRPTTERDRVRWNETVAFPKYSWMAQVRVWDENRKWIWPNLPFLLRAHGQEREERYGGVDPGKGVDNDFAAVLIRPLIREASGEWSFAPDDSPAPLVSAEWYPLSAPRKHKQSIVHGARSDVFEVRLSQDVPVSQRLGVWLIYADFLDASLPATWPRQGEYAGGILAYFEVEWTTGSDGRLDCAATHLTPRQATGFEWATWTEGPQKFTKNLSLQL